MKPAIITGNQFASLFPPYVPLPEWEQKRRVFQRDERYAMPTLGWLLADYRAYFRAELERLGLTKWSAEDNDCDNRADLYRVLANVCKARMKLGDGLALSVAYVEYFTDRGDWHGINAAAVGPQTLVFIDPAYETGSTQVRLSQDELFTIRAIEF